MKYIICRLESELTMYLSLELEKNGLKHAAIGIVMRRVRLLLCLFL